MGYQTYIENMSYAHFTDNDIEEVALQEEPDLMQERLEVLDQTLESVISLCSPEEFYVVKLILSGFKKTDIARALNMSLLQIKEIQRMFVVVFADMLSQKFERVVSVSLVEEYLNNLKKEKHLMERLWDQWAGYRERTEHVKEEKEKQTLLREIEKYKKGGMQ